jgi:hypothetical protein
MSSPSTKNSWIRAWLPLHVFSVIPTVSKLLAILFREVIAEIHFRWMEASQNKSDVTIHFLFGGLVIHFAGIFHLSFSVQK